MALQALSLLPILFIPLASGQGSPHYLRQHCVCNWGTECLNLRKLLAQQAGDILLTRMICIQLGTFETSFVLRPVVKEHFKLNLGYDDTAFYVAARHWAPSLMGKNYEGYKGNRV
jgi:hypothetical protein